MAKIHCSVNNCHYWDEGNICAASEIMITSDQMGEVLPDTFDATQANMAQATPVNSCMSTCCKTFVDSADTAKVDGITREH
ncbi:MAG: DUF1540 domain-containing protein [Limnochordia bacterium]|jgi:hypothetical protein